MVRILGLMIVVFAIATVAGSGPTTAAPASKLIDPYWQNQGSSAPPSHANWDRFLDQYLTVSDDGINRLAYGQVDEAGRALLNDYLAELQSLDPTTLGRNDQYAYWVNLYNAATVAVVLEAWPVKSIRRIGGFLSGGPWDRDEVQVADRDLSLNDIEHGILRPIWQDARIHYAVNCASIGCPNLAPQAYQGATLEQDLNTAARDYVNHPRGAMVEDGRLTVSSIYHWYKVDFGDSDAGVIDHLRDFAEPGLASELNGVDRVHDHEYDWNLNETP